MRSSNIHAKMARPLAAAKGMLVQDDCRSARALMLMPQPLKVGGRLESIQSRVRLLRKLDSVQEAFT